MTVFEWLRQAKQRLQEAGLEQSMADVLLRQLLDWTNTEVMMKRGVALVHVQIDALEQALSRVLDGEPVQYVTGSEWFYGRRFKVSPAVLIPRPETEELVQLVLAEMAAMRLETVVDVGTGSGAIALSLKSERPDLLVTATDISPEALAVARINAAELAAEVTFLEGDLLQPLIDQQRKVAVIVSNPPYIAAAETAVMDQSVIAYEPHLALFAADDGLALYERMLQQLPLVLLPGGIVAFEIGYQQGEALTRMVHRYYPTATVTVLKDLAGHDRMLLIKEVLT
ncbi:peptide chain release factor N(5)-glutamine methyltransferase [Brochothrix campestris]|uniref:Release factor glutamine methyltransferase n=1 Tax=Brochothrix campestris FSL F6-1037 TaxID=1265861 RepID=W7CWC4_9LIST|nr:peptide chain release factor N(5)-glutamine methyltransferase [Brochothrix campestris]EUJ40061.1 N5-glutamine S-adenosyl-L-methionine-dependent methyltransferase [Brochothrix campestris FSL F6-1037]